MPIETIKFKDKEYPAFQSQGGASLWVREFAKQYCKGKFGVDIGYSKPEWQYPGSYGVDPVHNEHDAMDFPYTDLDYIHSSHCLEHVKENWHNVLDYWLTKIKVGGIIFLYLPHKSQEYWLPENNRKHIHSFDGSEISDYLRYLGHKVILSGVDLNNSFVVLCEKVGTPESVKDFIKQYNQSTSNIPEGHHEVPKGVDMLSNLQPKFKDIKQFPCYLPEGYLKLKVTKPDIGNWVELQAIYGTSLYETGIRMVAEAWDDEGFLQAKHVPEIAAHIRFMELNK